MGKWLQSGRRRDLCVLLAAAGRADGGTTKATTEDESEDENGREEAGGTTGELRGQRLKSQLESHYDDRIEPKAFYGSLSALVDAGFVEKRTAGIHDAYALTAAGERRLDDHYEWMRDCLETS
ncbi:helix-turn-helix transcriptional regulator [Natrialba aegyptia]|uniref:PadR family transcriptional regulator n=1 Tax=Natrialba aegyptia DSM 13077 TaxID=1227491 RepID=M0BAI6_9EURY|nr:helix-turn-helix transcriptional regulator [Natrialba aegyptia]ELZ07916.1 PadR family transcriptional regulator [Natrialba aegyptia DSM 13077]